MTAGASHAELGWPMPPASLLDALSERWQRLAASAAGCVYELPSDGVEEAVRSESSRGARYDTILSFMRTPRVPDLDGLVAALERILADDGWILMIEPSTSGNRPRRDRLSSGLKSLRRHADRRDRVESGGDVVSALRAGGFTVTDLHRRDTLSAPARWRSHVEIRARRETPASVVNARGDGRPSGS